jgi:hypothetical protein
LYGIQFPGNQSAFSIASIGQVIGFIIGFLVSLFFCVSTKVYCYLGLSFVCLICCTILFSRNNYFKLKKAQEIDLEITRF